MRDMIKITALLTCAQLTLWGCGGEEPNTSGGAEAGVMAGAVSGVEAGVMAGAQAGTEAGTEAGVMAGTQAGAQAGTEAGVMAGTQAGTQAGTEAGVMAGTEAGTEAGVMAGTEAGTEAGVMAGTQAGTEAGTEAGVMAGAMAGMMGGTEPVEPEYEPLTEPQQHMGSAPEEGGSEHRFSLTEPSFVVMFTSDGVLTEGVYGCPEGEDTILNLYAVDESGSRELVSTNDDGGTGLCSRLQEQLDAGRYVVEVVGFAGRAVGSYVLDLFIAPLLSEGEACDLQTPTQGVCSEGFVCADNLCVNARPMINEAVAYTRESELFISLSGFDADNNATYLDFVLYDDALNELEGDFRSVQRTGGGSFEVTYNSNFFELSLATQVGLIISDRTFYESDEMIIPLAPHPTLALGEACELSRQSGQCDEGLICAPLEADPTAYACDAGVAPTLSTLTAYSDSGLLALVAEGSDANGDVSQLELALYNQDGALIDLEGEERRLLNVEEVRAGSLAEQSLFLTRYLNLGDHPEAVAAEVRLVDSSGLMSAPLLNLISPLPARAVGEACDLARYESSCGAGFCVPQAESADSSVGVCIERLPGLREACDELVGCSEGLVCYSDSNSGGIQALYGTCLTACDENGADLGGEVGCAEGETCVPDFPWREFGFLDMPSPGFCLPHDNCTPSNVNEVCGEGDHFCRRDEETTTCIDLSRLLPERAVAEGEACDGSVVVCQEGLACEYEVCRASCIDDTSCAEGESCRSWGDGGYQACVATCDVIGQDCANGEVCALREVVNGEIIGVCQEGTTQGEVAQGESCTFEGVDNPGYWGTCAGSALCQDITSSGETTCYELCTSDNNPCEGQSACIDRLLNDEGVGLCFNGCNVFNNLGCEPTESCLLVGEGLNSTSERNIVGLCRENPNAGVVARGGACVFDSATATSDCAAGQLCADIYGNGDECVELCQVDEAGVAVVACDPSQRCLFEQLGAPIFEDMPHLGVCINN